jgi:hypothetical protein
MVESAEFLQSVPKKNSIGRSLAAMIAVFVAGYLLIKYYEPINNWLDKGNSAPKKKHWHRKTKAANTPNNSDGGAVAGSSSSHSNPPSGGEPAS